MTLGAQITGKLVRVPEAGRAGAAAPSESRFWDALRPLAFDDCMA